MIIKITYSIIYMASISIANIATFKFGPEIMPLNAFLLVGIDFSIRNELHDILSKKNLMIIILSSGLISFAVNPSSFRVSEASVIAFSLSSIAGVLIYQLMSNFSWGLKSLISNSASSLVDSIIFPIIAFGIVPWWIVVAQIACKITGGLFWSYVIRV